AAADPLAAGRRLALGGARLARQARAAATDDVEVAVAAGLVGVVGVERERAAPQRRREAPHELVERLRVDAAGLDLLRDLGGVDREVARVQDAFPGVQGGRGRLHVERELDVEREPAAAPLRARRGPGAELVV